MGSIIGIFILTLYRLENAQGSVEVIVILMTYMQNLQDHPVRVAIPESRNLTILFL